MHGLLGGPALCGRGWDGLRVRSGLNRRCRAWGKAAGTCMRECCSCFTPPLVAWSSLVLSAELFCVGQRLRTATRIGKWCPSRPIATQAAATFSHVRLCRVHLGTAFGEGAGLADNVGAICDTLVPPHPPPHSKALARHACICTS